MKALFLMCFFYLIFSYSFAQTKNKEEELNEYKQKNQIRKNELKEYERDEKMKKELKYIQEVIKMFEQENDSLSKDAKSEKRTRSFAIITDFRILPITTEKIENKIFFQNSTYHWKLYYLKKYSEPCFLFFHVLPNFSVLNEKDKKIKDKIREKQIAFGNITRETLQKHKENNIETIKAINELLFAELEKCQKMQNCENCWFNSLCN